MSTGYSCYFTKNGNYMGGFALQSHTTKTALVQIKEDYPYLFVGSFYTGYEGDYQIIEVNLKCIERFKKSLVWVDYEYIGSLQGIMDGMDIALREGFHMFLGSE